LEVAEEQHNYFDLLRELVAQIKTHRHKINNNNNNDRLTAFDPGQPG